MRIMAAPHHQPNVQEHESVRNDVTVVVVGQTGSGMSTLVNGLIGAHTVKTGWSAKPLTKDVEVFTLQRNDVNLTIVATPGLSNPDRDPSTTFHEIATKTQGRIDLLIYCHSMKSRITRTDVKAIGHIADILRSPGTRTGCSWENVLYVLTFANTMPLLLEEEFEGSDSLTTDSPTTVEERFVALRDDLTQAIHSVTQQVIQERQGSYDAERIAHAIPVVPAGFRKAAICGCDDWLSELWRTALSRVNKSAASAFIDVTALHRLQPVGGGPDKTQKLPAERNLFDDQALQRYERQKALRGARTSLIWWTVVGICTAAGALLGGVVAHKFSGVGGHNVSDVLTEAITPANRLPGLTLSPPLCVPHESAKITSAVRTGVVFDDAIATGIITGAFLGSEIGKVIAVKLLKWCLKRRNRQ